MMKENEGTTLCSHVPKPNPICQKRESLFLSVFESSMSCDSQLTTDKEKVVEEKDE